MLYICIHTVCPNGYYIYCASLHAKEAAIYSLITYIKFAACDGNLDTVLIACALRHTMMRLPSCRAPATTVLGCRDRRLPKRWPARDFAIGGRSVLRSARLINNTKIEFKHIMRTVRTTYAREHEREPSCSPKGISTLFRMTTTNKNKNAFKNKQYMRTCTCTTVYVVHAFVCIAECVVIVLFTQACCNLLVCESGITHNAVAS